MKIVIAIDSFKGSLTTVQAGEAVKAAAARVFEGAEVYISPLADGGEGTTEAILLATGGKRRTLTVTGPLGTPVTASYGILEDTGTAVMEMSAAAGITLLSPTQRDPLYTTTFGVGEMILDALDHGCRSFLMGIGGSATNDGGIGMLQALGAELLDENGKHVPFGAIGLEKIVTVRTVNMHPALKECSFKVACDVTNPLCGERGCSAVFGPQKGATPETVLRMDAAMASFAAATRALLPMADADAPGAGAAGGLGFSLMAYLGAELCSGVSLVMDATRLATHVSTADLVVTGEGRLDGQSAMGKAPAGVAALAKGYGKHVIAFCGCTTPEARVCNECGIDAYFPILQKPCTVEEAMDISTAAENLTATAEQAFRLIRAYQI